MYTRCTGCHTTHPVNARLLAQGGGKYRCGKCQKIGNALDALFDVWPSAGDRPPAAGDLPVLGLSIDLGKARESRLNPEEAALTGDPDHAPAKKGKRLFRSAWIVLAIVVSILIAAGYMDFQDRPLTSLPYVNSLLIRFGLQDPPAPQVYRDLDQIHLVSRELISHPYQQGMLQLTATIVNRAPRPQPYPDLEVTLLDSGGEPVSRTRFTPADYLAGSAPRNAGMTPEAFLPLTLELPDPGMEAVGFELNFLQSR